MRASACIRTLLVISLYIYKSLMGVSFSPPDKKSFMFLSKRRHDPFVARVEIVLS